MTEIPDSVNDVAQEIIDLAPPDARDRAEALVEAMFAHEVRARERIGTPLMAALGRIRAAAESDPDLPSPLRTFLLRESEPGRSDYLEDRATALRRSVELWHGPEDVITMMRAAYIEGFDAGTTGAWDRGYRMGRDATEAANNDERQHADRVEDAAWALVANLRNAEAFNSIEVGPYFLAALEGLRDALGVDPAEYEGVDAE